MAADDDKASKTEAPTQHRLDQARGKGDVAKSQDLPTFMALTAAASVLILGGGTIAQSIAGALLPFLAHPEQFDLSGEGTVEVMRMAIRAAAPGLIVLVVASLAGVAGNLVQHGFLWAPSKLAPDFNKLNPLTGLKRMFGVDSLVEFLKSVVKIVAIGAVAWWVLRPKADQFSGLSGLQPVQMLPYAVEMIRGLAVSILIALGVVALFDWLWTRHRFTVRMRMSREDIRQETKESDGDPHVKARQRNLRVQRAKRRMMQNLPTATLVVMNPTHYAVALRYVQGETAAPICVAKGLDNVALKIRAIAEQHGVPVIEDPPLARLLYASIEIDETIPREHYQAVAKIIGFVMGGGRRPGPEANAGRPARL
jgi:flagellar biosynthetic protein FlhB